MVKIVGLVHQILFDYLQVNLEPSILVSNIGHAWSEATEAIRRAEVTDDSKSINRPCHHLALALQEDCSSDNVLIFTKD